MPITDAGFAGADSGNYVAGTFFIEDKGSEVLAKAAKNVEASTDQMIDNLREFNRGQEDAGAKLSALSGIAEGVSGGLADLGKAAFSAAKDLMEMVLASGEAAEVIQNLALTTGATISEVQQFQAATKIAGVSMGSFESSVLRLQRAIGSSSKSLEKWGFSANELMKKPAVAAFKEVIASINELGTHTQRVAALNDLFGRGGAKSLLPLMDAMDGMADKSKALNELTEEQIKVLGQVDDASDRLSISWGRLIDKASAFLVVVLKLDAVLDNIAKGIGGTPDQKKSLILGGNLSFMDPKRGDQPDMSALDEFYAKYTKLGTIKLPTIEEQVRLLGEKLPKAAKVAKDDIDKLASSLTKMSAAAESHGDPFWAKWEADMKLLDGLAKLHTDEVKEQEEAGIRLTDQTELQLLAENKVSAEYQKQLVAGVAILKIQMAERLEAARWEGALTGVAMLADTIGGQFGDMLQVVGNIGDAFKDWGDKLPMEKFNAIASAVGQIGGQIGGKAGGGIQGAAGGAMAGAAIGSIIPGFGTVAGGIVGGLIGGLMGVFGAGKKQAEALKKKQDEAMDAFAGMFDDWKNARKEMAGVGVAGATAIADAIDAQLKETIGDQTRLTAEQMSHAGDYLAASFAMLRESGMSVVQALDALQPSIDKMSEAGMMGGAGGQALLELSNWAALNENVLLFISGIGLSAQALSGFGMLTQEIATQMSMDLGGAIKAMTDAGTPYMTALALSAQDLFNLKEAAENSGVELDDHTKKLIADAEAAGMFLELEDPLKKLVEIQNLMLIATAELVKLFGGTVPAAVQKMIDEFNNAKINVNVNVDVNGGGGGETTYTGGGGGGAGSTFTPSNKPSNSESAVNRAVGMLPEVIGRSVRDAVLRAPRG